MNKWIAEFELEDGDKMPEHMDLTYKGIKLDFHCRPITECEDAISRQEVIETIKELNWRYNGHPGGEVYGAIIELPSVWPKPKVGHWVYEGEGSGYKKWHCSNCKTLVRNSLKPWYKFCPNCGVKMVDVFDINDGKMSEIPTGSESEKT